MAIVVSCLLRMPIPWLPSASSRDHLNSPLLVYSNNGFLKFPFFALVCLHRLSRFTTRRGNLPNLRVFWKPIMAKTMAIWMTFSISISSRCFVINYFNAEWLVPMYCWYLVDEFTGILTICYETLNHKKQSKFKWEFNHEHGNYIKSIRSVEKTFYGHQSFTILPFRLWQAIWT